MKKMNSGRIALIAAIFVLTHAAILLISEYVLFNFDVLSADAVKTKYALMYLIMFTSIVLWVQYIRITLTLCKKGIDAKTIEKCGFYLLNISIPVAILFAEIRLFFVRYYGVNIWSESLVNSASGAIYMGIFGVNALACMACGKLIIARYQKQ